MELVVRPQQQTALLRHLQLPLPFFTCFMGIII
ncbi:hypothetical protein CFP56_035112 [Quercus suber]|uniref:Uncharacterized protein n=1 Tax=Quercus suber TaxID=58331 RepID=A0AAW0JAS3_QUESU